MFLNRLRTSLPDSDRCLCPQFLSLLKVVILGCFLASSHPPNLMDPECPFWCKMLLVSSFFFPYYCCIIDKIPVLLLSLLLEVYAVKNKCHSFYWVPEEAEIKACLRDGIFNQNYMWLVILFSSSCNTQSGNVAKTSIAWAIIRTLGYCIRRWIF